MSQKHVMIRSEQGCLRCPHKVRLVGNGQELSVECNRNKEAKSNEQV